jgi:type IV pilus assembly protein PilW
MISITIGLIIAIAAMSAYIGASGASKIADAHARMNEDAQAALAILSQQIRMAGNNPDQPNRVSNVTATLASVRNPVYIPTPTYAGFALAPGTFTLSGFSIRGCDGNFSNISSAANIDTLTCAGTTTTLPDSIAISYEADKYNTAGTSPTDCLGNSLALRTATLPAFTGITSPATTASTSVGYRVAENRFYIGTSTGITSPSLYCKGNGAASTQQPLVENVEDLQLQYGTVSATGTSTTATVAGYLHALEILSDVNLAALASDAARWDKVRTVRICIVVRSEGNVVSDADSASYLDCAGNPVISPDLRLRRAYSTTVVLRNRQL